MGRKCSVPKCRSNYDGEKTYVPSFLFPKEENRRKVWIRNINRADFQPSSTAVVCVKHFNERYIIREDSVTRVDGTVLTVPRKKICLTQDAIPTIFPDQPSYLSKSLANKRKSPSKRMEAVISRDEEEFQKWCEKDVIKSFEHLKQQYETKLPSGWLSISNDESIVLYQIDVSDSPKIIVSVKVLNCLTVKLWHSGYELDINSFEFILGQEGKCDKWTKFDCLLNKLSCYEEKYISVEQKVSHAVHVLEKCCSEADESEEIEISKLRFLTNQLMLVFSKQPRYTSDVLVWAATVYFSYPASYVLIRSSKIMTLPHPVYLKKISETIYSSKNSTENEHAVYLKKKSDILSENEKIVILMLDEIYVAPSMSYTKGELIGTAVNSKEEATTVQTFMISSIFSKNKDVVSLIPVRNLTAELLYTYTCKVLKLLSEYNFNVLVLISDNNRVNRNMFTLLCNGKFESPIDNPYSVNQSIFFLFDAPHILKCIRNNWMNTKNETFYFPNPADYSEILMAKVSHLKQLYEIEKSHILKQAPKLSQKVLFPTSTEKQNVKLAINLFDENNATTLSLHSDELGADSKGTKIFIEHIMKWWKILNVKHPQKGLHCLDSLRYPVTSNSSNAIEFLKDFETWLNAWSNLKNLNLDDKKKLGIPGISGMLTKETQFALQITTASMVKIVDHIFTTFKPSYILLGKFQTDSLEARFGQYRQMCGGNYTVSFRQILESEHKLKILNLLSLYSATNGEFHIKSLDCNEPKSEEAVIPDVFYQVFNSFDDVEIKDTTMSVIIYIAGYVAHKVSTNLNCKYCAAFLFMDKPLEFESPENIYQYLKLTDRGNLKWPKEFTLDVVIQAFQVFQKLISEKFEEQFLKSKNQKQIVMKLVLEKIDLLDVMIYNIECSCENSRELLLQKCLSIIANIFLNNYSKTKNDNRVSSNKRKMSVFLSQ